MEYLFSDRVWLAGRLQPATICIENDLINDVLAHRHELAKDYTGSVIMPGVIDCHVHINEPGRTDWEGFNTATRAAARGGTTMLVDMPLNSSPVVTNITAFKEKMAATAGQLHVNCGFWAGAIGQDPNEVKVLIEAGCLGIKVFLSDSGLAEFPNISKENLELLMAAFQGSEVPILAHCELDTIPVNLAGGNDPLSYAAYLASRPKIWENEAVQLFISLGKKYDCRTHVVHLASEEIIPWISDQKAGTDRVTVETCTHYLFFEAENIADGNTLLKCAPPIRHSDTKRALIAALKSGVINFITTDHSPAPAHLKEIASGDFTKAWGGISGLQFLLSASWTALRNDLCLEAFIPLLTEKPAGFLGLQHQVGKIAPRYHADICIWQPEAGFTVEKEKIEHKHKETPYLDRFLYGSVIATYVNGSCVFEDGKIKVPGKGKMI